MRNMAQNDGSPVYTAFPLARNDEDIVEQEVTYEYIVYDLRTDKVHCLNPTAATVWQWCDGKTSPSEMVERLAKTHGLPAKKAEPLLWLTLDRLEKADLMQGKVIRPRQADKVSRRSLLRILGGAALLPVVYTFVAPTAAQAQSGCVPLGGPCNLNNPGVCCSKACLSISGGLEGTCL